MAVAVAGVGVWTLPYWHQRINQISQHQPLIHILALNPKMTVSFFFPSLSEEIYPN